MAETERYAVVVMHGIGEQQRYSTLDGFVQGCTRAMRKLGWTVGLSSHTTAHKGDRRHTHVHATVEVPANEKDGESQRFVAEFYEYYWASMTKGRIVWTRVVSWLRKSALAPLGQLSFNLAAMRRASQVHNIPFKGQKVRLALYRELFRFVIFVALFVGLLALPVFAVKQWSDVKDDLNKNYLEVLPDPGLRLGAGFLVLVLALIAFWSATRLLRDRKRASGFPRLWLLPLAIALILSVIAWLIANPAAGFNNEFWNEVGDIWWPVLLIVLTVAIAAVVRWALVKTVGDIALFVDSDERSDLYDTRKEILAGAEQLLLDVLRADDVKRVYLVGHSLGTVVAVACVDRLIRRARITAWDPLNDEVGKDDQLAADDLAKLSGLVTFGSPLDKVYYFFNRPAKREQPVRIQILKGLHGFRRIDPPADLGEFEFTPPDKPDPAKRLEEMPWRNYHSPIDVVSGHLDFFHPVQNICMRSTHTGYWKKPYFYDTVVDGWWGKATWPAGDIKCGKGG